MLRIRQGGVICELWAKQSWGDEKCLEFGDESYLASYGQNKVWGR